MPKYFTKPFDDDSLKDPPANANKDSKKSKRKDSDASSLKKSKDKESLSKEGKAPSKSSKYAKTVNAEATIQDVAVDDKELTHDEDMDAEGVTHNDTAPKQDRSKWFKQRVVERDESPDLKWHKEPNADDAPEQNWFNETMNAQKDPVTFDDLMGTTLDFTKPLGRTTIPVDLIFNKDQEYLKTGNAKKNYALSLTKPKVARYELERRFSRANQKEYAFNEADFVKLHFNDIKDMYLLYAQNKLHHLKGNEIVDLLNITRPQVRCDGLYAKEPYTRLHESKGVVYLNKNNIKNLMKADELYKLSDGTVKPVRDILNSRLYNFELGYNAIMPNWVNTYAMRITQLIAGIEDSHHGPSDAMHNPPSYSSFSQKKYVSFLVEINIFLSIFSLRVEDNICKFAKKGLTPSQIGVILRDSHGIAQVNSVTGSKILRILKGHGLAPEIPEDLYHLIKKAVAIRKHLERNRKDKDSKFRLILVESRIHRLARYYKKTKKLPPVWK
nr:40S ribosomal protein S13 [Tanacetum cinerariifolium]